MGNRFDITSQGGNRNNFLEFWRPLSDTDVDLEPQDDDGPVDVHRQHVDAEQDQETDTDALMEQYPDISRCLDLIAGLGVCDTEDGCQALSGNDGTCDAVGSNLDGEYENDLDFESAYHFDDFEAMELYDEALAYALEEAGGYWYGSEEEEYQEEDTEKEEIDCASTQLR